MSNQNEKAQQQIFVCDENLVQQTFYQPTVYNQNPKQEKVKSLNSKLHQMTRAAVMKREYDQKLEQTRQQTQKYLIEEELREQRRFRDTKMKLIQGNETIIREVDNMLLISDQEKQLAKEKIFIDYEMNTFVPIHAKISQQVEKQFEKRNEQRFKQHHEFAKYSKRPGGNLDDINENAYNPFSVESLKVSVKVSDPVERTAQIKQADDQIVNNIEKLTGLKEATFEGHSQTLQNLRKGDISQPSIKKERDILDVKQWNNIHNLQIMPDTVRGRKRLESQQNKTQPIPLDDDFA